MTLETQVENLERDIARLLHDFHVTTGKEVEDICVRYAMELPSGKRICLLTPDITIYDDKETGIV